MYRVHNTWSFKLSLFLIKFQCDCFPESQEKCFYYYIILRNRTMNKGEMTFFSITQEMHNTFTWNLAHFCFTSEIFGFYELYIHVFQYFIPMLIHLYYYMHCMLLGFHLLLFLKIVSFICRTMIQVNLSYAENLKSMDQFARLVS